MARWSPEAFEKATQEALKEPPSPREALEIIWEGSSKDLVRVCQGNSDKRRLDEIARNLKEIYQISPWDWGFEKLLLGHFGDHLVGFLKELDSFLVEKARGYGFSPECEEALKEQFWNEVPYNKMKAFFLSCAKKEKKG